MADMHSFDIVSEINMQEVTNAVQQSIKEIQTRYDFKGTKSSIELIKDEIIILADDEFKRKAIVDILQGKLIKRSVSPKALKFGKPEEASGSMVRQSVGLQKGIEQDKAKKIVAMVKEMKLKVQASIQGDQVRLSGKNIDDLQSIMKKLKETEFDFAMQFVNYR